MARQVTLYFRAKRGNMTEDIKELIEKIQQDGVKIAEDKAKRIEIEAKQQAEEIVKKAKSQADKLIKEAQEKISKTEEAAKASLKQAARDMLLTLRKEICTLLDKIIKLNVSQALAPQELAKIIAILVEDFSSQDKTNVAISLSKEDAQSLEKSFLGGLKEEIKKSVILKPSEDISGGFVISYDGGKSHFDFSDKALAEYISQYLKPKLGELLK